MALEVVKMKQGMSYSCKEKTIILNVFKYFKTIYPEKCVTEIVRRTAKATGCSEKSIFQFRKEEASVEGFKEPSKTKIRKNININSRFIKYDNNVRQGIRNIIYDLKYRNIVPSLSTLLKNINSNEKLPNFSVMTLRRLLRDMGFYYEKEKTGNKSILVERTDIKKEHLKKENLPIHTEKGNQNVANISQQLMQPPVTNSHNLRQNNMKPLVVPHNNMIAQQNQMRDQMYIANHGQRPISLVHLENDIVDPIYISSSIMPHHHHHQIHNGHTPLPPPLPPPSLNLKADMGFMHSSHPHVPLQ